jgi:hypothetical protein
MGLHLSTARDVAPWLLAITVTVAAILCVLLGVPSVEDVGSWRWTVVRPA